MLRRLTLVALAMAALLAGPGFAGSASASSGPNGVVPCESEFEATVLAFDEAFFAHDLEGFASFYHDNATAINNRGQVIPTKAAIKAGFAGLFSLDFIATFTTIKQVVEGCATGVVVSDFVLEIPALNARFHFVNSLTWIRDRGRWQVLVDQNTPVL